MQMIWKYRFLSVLKIQMDLNDACVVIKLIVATVRTNRYTLNNALFPRDCIVEIIIIRPLI